MCLVALSGHGYPFLFCPLFSLRRMPISRVLSSLSCPLSLSFKRSVWPVLHRLDATTAEREGERREKGRYDHFAFSYQHRSKGHSARKPRLPACTQRSDERAALCGVVYEWRGQCKESDSRAVDVLVRQSRYTFCCVYTYGVVRDKGNDSSGADVLVRQGLCTRLL